LDNTSFICTLDLPFVPFVLQPIIGALVLVFPMRETRNISVLKAGP